MLLNQMRSFQTAELRILIKDGASVQRSFNGSCAVVAEERRRENGAVLVRVIR